MSKPLSYVFAVILTAASCASASAGTLRCRSVNGNVTCSGSGAVSCQTVNGHTVCVGGHGDVVQSFGAGVPTPEEMQKLDPPDLDGGPDAQTSKDDLDEDAAPPLSAKPQLFIERRDASGPLLSLERSGDTLRLRTPRTAITINR
jgi:hypothetical protein